MDYKPAPLRENATAAPLLALFSFFMSVVWFFAWLHYQHMHGRSLTTRPLSRYSEGTEFEFHPIGHEPGNIPRKANYLI